MKASGTRLAVALSAAIFAGLPLLPASAQTPERFYAGKNLTLYIGFGSGGSYDFYAHLAARHLARFVPGHPTIVPENMPGAGSFKAANYLYSVAPRDGSAIGIVTQTVALEEVLGTPGVAYKSAEFNWLARAVSILEIEFTWAGKAKTIAEIMSQQTPVASTGPGSPSDGYPKLFNAVLGTKFKIITGYPSSADALLAVERGEVDGASINWNAIKRGKRDWIENKKMNILVQYELQRSPELPDVPAIVELGRNDEEKRVLAFYTGSTEIGRSFFAPPGVPADRVAALRQSFAAMFKDPEFIADAEKSGAELSPASGEQIQKVIADTANAPASVVAKARSAFAEK
jgi:tripartite-type tricarboxylate transporter receptor subunit TctC